MSIFAALPVWVWASIVPAGIGVGILVAPRKASAKGKEPVAHPKPGAPGTAKAGSHPTIKLGSTGEAVKEWQGILKVTADGQFGPGTHAATVALQKALGLVADGVVGPKTWTMATTGKGAPNPATGGGGSPGGGGAAIPGGFLGEAPPDGSSGRDWAERLPKNGTEDREGAIMAAVADGFYVAPDMVDISYVKDGHSVTLQAWTDCLAIGHVDPIRVSVSHATAQRIADLLGMMLPTTRMADAAYTAAAAKLPVMPIAQADLPKMSTTAEMIKYSDKVEGKKQSAGKSFVRDAGKDWVNSERLIEPDGTMAKPKASSIGAGGGGLASANFGWHSDSGPLKSPGGARVFQSVGLAHDQHHVDYSQVLTLYGKNCIIDGGSHSIESVLLDPDLAYLLSDEVTKGKACKVYRYPPVQEPQGNKYHAA